MRDHAVIRPRFWVAGTGKRLRDDPWARLCAVYLMSAPGSNMTGVYYLSLGTLAGELGCSIEGASKALRRCCDEGFCAYDADEDIVFVFGMAREQVGESLDAKDKRVQGIRKQLAAYKKHRFYNDFVTMYGKSYNLKLTPVANENNEAPSKPHRSPSEARSGSGQDQEQGRSGQERDEITHTRPARFEKPPTPDAPPPGDEEPGELSDTALARQLYVRGMEAKGIAWVKWGATESVATFITLADFAAAQAPIDGITTGQVIAAIFEQYFGEDHSDWSWKLTFLLKAHEDVYFRHPAIAARRATKPKLAAVAK